MTAPEDAMVDLMAARLLAYDEVLAQSGLPERPLSHLPSECSSGFACLEMLERLRQAQVGNP